MKSFWSLRLLVVAGASLLGVAFLCGAAITVSQVEIRTQRLVIVDEYGREVGILSGSNGHARLELHNLTTRTSAVLAAEDESSLMLGTADKDRVRLFNKGELSALEIRGEQGKLRILVGISEKGKPKVVLRGTDEETIWQAPPEEEKSDNL